MKPTLMALIAAFVGSSFALADTPVKPADADKIKATLQAWGCSGGKMEQETEGTSVYEVDDATCKDGQYDVKLDKDFKVLVISRD